MTSPRLVLFLAGSLAAATAFGQSLMCPPPPAGRPCDAYHYHVQMYRPDTRGFSEFYGGTSFATEAACNRAREQQVAANMKVVDYLRANKDQKYEPDRVGACHCDMTTERSSATYLTEPQRIAQIRNAEEIRLRVRERLLDRNAPSDSEAVQGLWADPPSTPILGAPKLVPLPATPPRPLVTSADDLQPTRTLDTPKPAVAALDIPLLVITPDGAATPAASAAGTSPSPAAIAESAPAPVAAPAPPVSEPVVEERVEPQAEVEIAAPADEEQFEPAERDEDSPERAAERFISYETQRIQSVLRASSAISDETMKTKIFEAAMERIQLLSNFRLLIEGSGVRSALATAARDAQTEEQRLALVSRLFGSGVRPHWAPQDAADVVFPIDAEIASAPESVLRDTTGRFSDDQKKRALYLVLARTQPTEEQRLWLTTVMEGFLR